jgi:hypothetical protein
MKLAPGLRCGKFYGFLLKLMGKNYLNLRLFGRPFVNRHSSQSLQAIRTYWSEAGVSRLVEAKKRNEC